MSSEISNGAKPEKVADFAATATQTISADQANTLHDTQTGVMFAASKASKTNPGVPSVAIPTSGDPSLTMWRTMQKRVIKADYWMRIQAAEDDVFRMLGSIVDACAIGLWTFTADDIEASSETIAEMRTWIRETSLMEAYKGGGINSDDRGALFNYRVHEGYALWINRDNKAGSSGKINKFANLPINGLRRMTNPRDPTQYYFYQKYDKPRDYTDPDAWDDMETEQDTSGVNSQEQRVWYIPEGEKGRNAKDDYTKEPLYPKIKEEDWVLPLENLIYVKNPSPPLNDFTVSAIAAKRYMVLMTPAAVQLGIVPFDVLTFGNEEIRPPVVDGEIKETNPDLYAKQMGVLGVYNNSVQEIIHNLNDCATNGKPFGVQWGVEHKRIEPSMSLQADFVETTMFGLNQIIAFSTGIPLTIITSVGTELATSRLTMATTSIALMAVQESFREVLMHILRLQFDKEIEEQGIAIVLQELDNTDQKTKSEIYNLISQAANHLKSAGASEKTLEQFVDAATDIPVVHSDFSSVEVEDGAPTEAPVEPTEPTDGNEEEEGDDDMEEEGGN